MSLNVKLPPFPVETTLMLMGGKWKVLTAHFRIMKKNGLIILKVFPLVLPKMEYTLTGVGQSLKQVHDAMLDWGKLSISNS